MSTNVKINDEFFNLSNVVEEGRFVEQYGEYYCIAENCDNCPYVAECETEPAKLETTITPSTRRMIGVGDQNFNPFLREITETQYKSGSYDKCNTNWVHKNKEEGILTDSPNTIYKIVDDIGTPFKDNEYDHIIYNPEDKEWYCIRQVCSECPHYMRCKPRLIERPKQYLVTAIDLRSQEPRLNAMLSHEEEWLQVFRNDTIRNDPNKTKYIDYLFQKELNINTEKNTLYWSFLDEKFFLDQTKLYEFNSAVIQYRLDKTENNKRKVQEHIDSLKVQWGEFYEKEQLRLKKKKTSKKVSNSED